MPRLVFAIHVADRCWPSPAPSVLSTYRPTAAALAAAGPERSAAWPSKLHLCSLHQKKTGKFRLVMLGNSRFPSMAESTSNNLHLGIILVETTAPQDNQ